MFLLARLDYVWAKYKFNCSFKLIVGVCWNYLKCFTINTVIIYLVVHVYTFNATVIWKGFNVKLMDLFYIGRLLAGGAF
jgi:hypothetical protein